MHLPSKSLAFPQCFQRYFTHIYVELKIEWLYELYKKAVGQKLTIPIESYISNFVMEIPLPPPRNIKVKFNIGDKWTTISRPPANTFPLADVPFVILFKTLGIANVLTLFKCLLLEEKVRKKNVSTCLKKFITNSL